MTSIAIVSFAISRLSLVLAQISVLGIFLNVFSRITTTRLKTGRSVSSYPIIS